MPTVTLPAIGTVERKYVLAGGAVVAGIVAYAYWKHRSASSAANAASAIDPATGLPYSAENQATTGYVNPNPNADGSSTVSGTGAITTDAQWTADVETKLTGLYDATFLVNTLGKYLAGQALTSDEALLIRAAWAVSGHPPGNQQIILTTTNPNPGGGTTTGPIVANRNNNLGVTIGSTNLHSWNDLARWAYWWPGHSNAADMHLNGLFGSLLAHANGQSGLSDPSKLKNIHLPDTLAGT